MEKTQGRSRRQTRKWYDAESGASLIRSLRHRLVRMEDQPIPKLAMRKLQTNTPGFAVCIRNDGYSASLETRKLYPVVEDPDAEANDLIRVIDESGEDYVYPTTLFEKIDLPVSLQRALRLAS
jgi:hypothetical protein